MDKVIQIKEVVVRFLDAPQNEVRTIVGVGQPDPQLWDTVMDGVIFYCFEDQEEYESYFWDRKGEGSSDDQEFEILQELWTDKLNVDEYLQGNTTQAFQTQTAWLLFIDHEEGIHKSLHETEDGAKARLEQFLEDAGAKSESDYFLNTNSADWYIIEELEIN